MDSLSQDERYYPKRDSIYSNRSYALHSTGVTSTPVSRSDYAYPPHVATSFVTPFSEAPSAMTQNLCLPSRSVSQSFAPRSENGLYRTRLYAQRNSFSDSFEYQPLGLFHNFSSSTRNLSPWNVEKGIPDKTPVHEQEKQHVSSMNKDER